MFHKNFKNIIQLYLLEGNILPGIILSNNQIISKNMRNHMTRYYNYAYEFDI